MDQINGGSMAGGTALVSGGSIGIGKATALGMMRRHPVSALRVLTFGLTCCSRSLRSWMPAATCHSRSPFGV
jgi:hypothetical protein